MYEETIPNKHQQIFHIVYMKRFMPKDLQKSSHYPTGIPINIPSVQYTRKLPHFPPKKQNTKPKPYS